MILISYVGFTVGENRRLIHNNRLKRMVNNTEYRAFKKALLWTCKQVINKMKESLELPYKKSGCLLILKTEHDANNLVKPIHDVLEEAGIIKNDAGIVINNTYKLDKKKGEKDIIKIVVWDMEGEK